MKQPKNWSLEYANGMLFRIFIAFGWQLYKETEQPWVVDNFCNLVKQSNTYSSFAKKIEKEVFNETDIGKIIMYIPQYFFPVLFEQIKQEKENTEMTDADLELMWSLFIQFLEFAYTVENSDEQENTSEEERFSTKMIIDECIYRLKQLKYADNDIKYLSYLSTKAVNEFKADSQS